MPNLDIIIKVTDHASGTIRTIKGNVDDLSHKGLSGLQSAMGKGLKVAAGIGIAAVAGLSAGLVSSIKSAADMEAQLSSIAAVMSKTKEEAAPLKDLILELGIDPKLKVSATEAADAIEMLARNGLNMTEIMGGAARSTVLLANSTGSDFSVAADIATDVMAVFKIEAADMADAVNGITSVVNNSKFSIDDFALALAQGGGVAAASGIEFSDFNAAIAGISPMFASGSDAGTSFKTMIQRLVPATNPAREAFADLGLMTEEGTSAFYDATGAMRPMVEVAGLLETALSGLSEEQKNALVTKAFGTDAVRAAVGLAELGAEGFTDLAGAMALTNAEASSATRMDNFAGSMEILSGIVETARIQIGGAFLPILTQLLNKFNEGSQTFIPAIVGWFTTMADVLGNFFDNMGEGMSVLDSFIEAIWDVAPQGVLDALVFIRDEAIPFVAGIVSMITSVVSFQDVLIVLGAGVAIWLAPILVAMAPVIAVIAAIMAGVVLLRNAWESNFGGIQEKTGEAMEKIRAIISRVLELVRGIWEGHGEETGGVVKGFLTFLTDTFSYTLDTILAFLDIALAILEGDWTAAWEGVVSIAEGAWELLKSAWTNVLSSIWELIKSIDWLALGRSIVEGIGAGISAGASVIWDALMGAVTGAWEGAKDFLGINSPSRLFAELGQQTMAGFAGGISDNAYRPVVAMQGAAGNTYASTYNMTFNGASNPNETAWAVQDAILQAQRRRGY